MNAALVSLLLHANDSVAETSHAARDGLAKVIGVVMGDEEQNERFRRHLAISCSNFTYPVFLRYFAMHHEHCTGVPQGIKGEATC